MNITEMKSNVLALLGLPVYSMRSKICEMVRYLSVCPIIRQQQRLRVVGLLMSAGRPEK